MAFLGYGRNTKRKFATLMTICILTTLGMSITGPITRADDYAARFTYVRLHCTPDNESHFTDVTVELTKENFAPPAAPIAIGDNQQVSRAFIAGFEAHWRISDMQSRSVQKLDIRWDHWSRVCCRAIIEFPDARDIGTPLGRTDENRQRPVPCKTLCHFTSFAAALWGMLP